MVYFYHIFILYLYVVGHLDFFYSLVLVKTKKEAMNMTE